MINTQTEKLVTFEEAAAALPVRPGGKAVHPKTVYLWALRGYGPKRIELESIRIGQRRVTSLEALQRFYDAVTAAESPRPLGGNGGGDLNNEINAGLHEHGLI